MRSATLTFEISACLAWLFVYAQVRNERGSLSHSSSHFCIEIMSTKMTIKCTRIAAMRDGHVVGWWFTWFGRWTVLARSL